MLATSAHFPSVPTRGSGSTAEQAQRTPHCRSLGTAAVRVALAQRGEAVAAPAALPPALGDLWPPRSSASVMVR